MKNDYEIRGDVTAIFLKNKDGIIETLISTSQLDKARSITTSWSAKWDAKGQRYYAVTKLSVKVDKKRRVMSLHRFLTDAPNNKVVDHINHNTLDNTYGNLRLTSRYVNMQNRDGLDRSNSSGVRGVFWHSGKKKWMVQMRAFDKKHYLYQGDSFVKAVYIAFAERRRLHADCYI